MGYLASGGQNQEVPGSHPAKCQIEDVTRKTDTDPCHPATFLVTAICVDVYLADTAGLRSSNKLRGQIKLGKHLVRLFPNFRQPRLAVDRGEDLNVWQGSRLGTVCAGQEVNRAARKMKEGRSLGRSCFTLVYRTCRREEEEHVSGVNHRDGPGGVGLVLTL
ncbi:hypothetical protein Bbelb_325680 [Branchiostoma belcheri]|nr:hypothetical protein Bbelb_325680 [Branchiostoma belcheri]